eukprot:528767-Pelagomonas_calceolata.AAC.3
MHGQWMHKALTSHKRSNAGVMHSCKTVHTCLWYRVQHQSTPSALSTESNAPRVVPYVQASLAVRGPLAWVAQSCSMGSCGVTGNGMRVRHQAWSQQAPGQ